MPVLSEVVRELYPFVVALYLIDGLAWISNREVVFTSLTGEGFRVRRPGANLMGLLPIAMDFRVAADRPILTTGGVLVPPPGQVTAGALSDPAEYSALAYEEAARSAVEHTTIRFPGTTRWKAPSAGAAKGVKTVIDDLAMLPEEQRDDRIRERLEAALDSAEARRRLEEFMAAADPLVALDDALFFTFLAVVPGGAILVPDNPVFLATVAVLATGLWAATGIATVRFSRLLAKLGLVRPDGLRLATVLLMPPLAFRGAHVLGSDLLHDLEPVAVAAALGPAKGFENIARAEIAAVDRALGAGGDDAWNRAWRLRSELLTRLLERYELHDAEGTAPQEGEGGLVCPECGVSYRSGFEFCSDCNVPLVTALRAVAASIR
jgi:hypothetical protein